MRSLRSVQPTDGLLGRTTPRAAVSLDSHLVVVRRARFALFSVYPFSSLVHNGLRPRLAAASTPALSESQKAWSEADARLACEDLIRQSATIPTTVKIHSFLGTSVFKAPSTGNLVVTSNFDAKNAFGPEIGYQAKCYFKPGIATGTVEIQQRLR